MSKSKENKVYAVGFKGFGPGMVCKPSVASVKQYQENTVFEESGGEICSNGEMHFCENPFDVLDYYPLVNNDGIPNEFATVEALTPTQKKEDKSCTSEIKIGAKLSLVGFCKASFDYLHKICSIESRDCQSGDYSQQSQSGNYSQQSQSGYSSQQSQSGNSSRQASVGNDSSCIATGNNCLVAPLGKNGKARGKKGCMLILVHYDENNAPIKTISGLVDGKKIKEDTRYVS